MTESMQSIHVFATHTAAEEAIRTLARSGFDVKHLSLIGKGYQTEEKPMGFYTAGDRIKAWGGTGAFWGGIWGMLLAPAVFMLPASAWSPWRAPSSPRWSAHSKARWWWAVCLRSGQH